VTDSVEAPDEEPSNNPDSAWLREQAKLAWDMGIRQVEDVRDLLNNMSTEEARANLADLTERLGSIASNSQEIFRRQAAILARMVDGPTRVAQEHLETQIQMLKRAGELAKDAEIDQLPALMVAYSQMPRPYEQGFYWPLDEEVRSDKQPGAD
jgi:hypothetical protein